MDERTLALMRDALYEHLTSCRFMVKDGGAADRFLQHMAPQTVQWRCPPPSPSPLPGSPHEEQEAEQRAAEADEAQRAAKENAAQWQQKCEEEKQARETAEKDARTLQDELQAVRQQYREAEQRATTVTRELTALKQRQLPQQDDLLQTQTFLDTLTPDMRSLMAPYFVTNHLPTFLVQCGQFTRLRQCWEACGKSVTSGKRIPGMTACLEYLLRLYNASGGSNPASLVTPTPGEPYRSDMHLRVASDGKTIRHVLLPGLQNPGGEVVQPPLVELHEKRNI